MSILLTKDKKSVKKYKISFDMSKIVCSIAIKGAARYYLLIHI
jgi:hypothetical protein